MAMKIKVHEASSRKYRQHPSDRIGITDDASAYIARKQGLDARAKAWKDCLERGVCLHEQGFCNTLSGMLESAISEIPHSDIAGVRFDLDVTEYSTPRIWWGWVYSGNEIRVAPDKSVVVEDGAGVFWKKVMDSFISRNILKKLDVTPAIKTIYTEGTDEYIEYGIDFDEAGMSEYILSDSTRVPSIKEASKKVTNLVIPIWEILVKASVIADKELVREFNRLP